MNQADIKSLYEQEYGLKFFVGYECRNVGFQNVVSQCYLTAILVHSRCVYKESYEQYLGTKISAMRSDCVLHASMFIRY